MRSSAGIILITASYLTTASYAGLAWGEAVHLEPVEVVGRDNLVGEAVSASQGLVGQQEIEVRPLSRTGEVLELVPGMVVTQHSGTGKANQYFLRGFNLDHGTDFASFVDGMPVNMRTHGHGQGYSDLNFIIPELISSISYKKGPYYADVGDFSGAGSAHMKTANYLNHGKVEITLGEDNYSRLLAMDSVSNGSAEWLYAVEANRYDGPWSDIDEDLDKLNSVLKHSRPLAGGELSLTLMAYDNSWNSADQIPQYAVTNGLIDELGSIDTTTGGESSRYSLSANWQRGGWQVSAYTINYDMTLWSNFTYFLDDETNGDQFEQVDDRWIYGGNASYQFNGNLLGHAMSNRFGMELRLDVIDEVGLYKTAQRQRLGTVRSDKVDELSTGIFWENQLAWTDKLRSIIGLRYDYYDFEVDSRIDENINGIDLSDNSGSSDEGLLSAKASLIYAFNEQWEVYGSAGQGFHSNDARGTTIQLDPADGAAVEAVDPLVRSLGAELGVRGFITEQLNTSLALWYLELDSELLFVGDAGNTEPSRKSERQGVEVTAYYHLNDEWTLDVEYAHADSTFADSDPAGDEIPGAIEQVWQLGLSADLASGWFGSTRLRYFGERPLEESGTVTSDSSTVVNLRAGYRWQNVTVKADVLNLLDSDDHDIDYLYESRLASNPSGVGTEDIHYHVLEPRTVRVSASYQF
jgi:hypothetical protein